MATGLLEGMQKLKVWNELILKQDRQFLWDDDVPDWDDQIEQEKPSIIFFKSQQSRENTGCVLVIPGGKYLYKSTNEAINVAKKLNEDGIDSAVLDYRVVPYSRDTILKDAKRAIRLLRFNAKEYGFDEEKIAVLGFSAGGNLATLCSLHGDDGDKSSPDPVERMSSRPNATVLCYSAVNVVDKYDDDEDFSLISYFDVVFDREYKQFPPTFIWQSMRDKTINYKTALELATVLEEMDVPVEMHLFPYGDHGQGLADTHKGEINKGDNYLASCWSDLCIRWLKNYGF